MPARVKAKQREKRQYCSLTIFGTSSEWRHSNRTSQQLILKSRRSCDENLLIVALWCAIRCRPSPAAKACRRFAQARPIRRSLSDKEPSRPDRGFRGLLSARELDRDRCPL